MTKESKNETGNSNLTFGNLPSPEEEKHPHYIRPSIPVDDLLKFTSELQNTLRKAETELGNIYFHPVSDAQRRRLRGSGVSRFGFIVNTHRLAADNPQFAPPILDINDLGEQIDIIRETRAVTVCLEQLQRMYADILLYAGDDAYRQSLIYYTSVRDSKRRGIPGAQAIFNVLRSFFKHWKHSDEAPTIPELERDVHALLHHRKDGKIVIEGRAKHTTLS